MKPLPYFLLFMVFFYSCSVDKKEWDSIRDSKSIDVYESFISKFPKSAYIDSAKQCIENIVFEKAIGQNTIEAFDTFLTKYPQSSYIDSINILKELLFFNRASKANEDSLYWMFLKKFPNSKFKDSVITFFFNEALKENTIISYEAFLDSFPLSGFSNKVKENISKLKEENTVIKSFSIKNNSNFEAEYKGTCVTHAEILSIQNGGFQLKGDVDLKNGKLIVWGYNAIHIWIGKLKYGGYIFDSDKKNPLQFQVTKDDGYVFIKGKGKISLPNGKIIVLQK